MTNTINKYKYKQYFNTSMLAGIVPVVFERTKEIHGTTNTGDERLITPGFQSTS